MLRSHVLCEIIALNVSIFLLRSNYNADAIVRLILPSGLRFCTQHEISDLQAAKSSPFVVTREDGCKNYGVAIVFYEEVTDTNICHAVHTLQVH